MEPTASYILGKCSPIHLHPQPYFTLYFETRSHFEAFLGLNGHVFAAALRMRLYHKAWPSFKRTFLCKDILLRKYEHKHGSHHQSGFLLWVCTLTQSCACVLHLPSEVARTEGMNNNRGRQWQRRGWNGSPRCQLCLYSPLFKTENKHKPAKLQCVAQRERWFIVNLNIWCSLV